MTTNADFAVSRRRRSTYFAGIVKRFCRNRIALVSFFVLLIIVLLAIFAPLFAPYDPYYGDITAYCQPPSPQHLLGTDEVGRDILSRLFYGARISLSVGFISVGISVGFGIIIGLTTAYFGKAWDSIMMRVADMIMAFPGVLLAIIFMSAFGKGIGNAIIAVSIVGIPGVSRVVRSATLSAKENDYVLSARAIGCSELSIMFRQILPNIMAPIIVNATMSMSGAILSTAALGFLGLGVQPPTAEWGNMLSVGRAYIYSAPHILTSPGVAISLTVLSFNLFGDGLRDALDPRLR